MNERDARPPQNALAAAMHCDPTLCPDADILVAFADGTLAEPSRDRVAAHVAECGSCAMAVRVALDAEAWAGGVAAELGPLVNSVPAGNVVVADFTPRTRSERRFRGPPIALSIAASGMLVVFAAVFFMRTPPVEDTLRGVPVVAIAPEDGSVLRQAPTSLRWPCAAAPTAASVEVLGADASPRWSGPAQECAAVLPESTRTALARGEYLWRVRNAAGEPLLGPFAFRVEP